jgi:hypothetical protein
MELLIIVAIWTVVVKRGVEDIIHTVKGGTPPRYAAAKARRKSGAAGRYWGQLWDDTWNDMSRRHADRRGRRLASPPSSSRPRGAATQFFAGLFQDGRRAARRSWDGGWTRLDERRREKSTRPRPGRQTVPGTVVPNAQDDSRPQDEARPGPEPRIVPTQDGTDLQFGDDPTDPTGTRDCPECHGAVVIDGEICLSCRDRQEQRNQHHDEQSVPDYPPDFGPDNQTSSPLASTTIQEGTATMTTTTPEVTGLEPAITFCETSAQAYNAMVGSIEQTMAALQAGDVTGPARDAFASAMEQSAAAATSMETAAAELRSHRIVAEAYDAATGAGTREFVRGGR